MVHARTFAHSKVRIETSYNPELSIAILPQNEGGSHERVAGLLTLTLLGKALSVRRASVRKKS